MNRKTFLTIKTIHREFFSYQDDLAVDIYEQFNQGDKWLNVHEEHANRNVTRSINTSHIIDIEYEVFIK